MTMLNGEPIETPNISTAPTPPPSATRAASDDYMARVLGVVAMILAFVFPLAGIVVSGVAISRSRATGQATGLPLAALIVSIVMTIVVVTITVVSIVLGVGLFTNIFEICQQLGPGIHVEDGVTYECNV